MVYIALRIDHSFAEVVAFVTEKKYGGFCVREVVDGVNEHWHFLLDASVKNIQAFRVALTRAVPLLKGNKSYSATEVRDLEHYERYLCKGSIEGVLPEVAWCHSLVYTEEKIKQLHDAWWVNNVSKKKRVAGSMIDYVVDEAKRQNVGWNNRDKLSMIYVKEVKARAKPLNMFAARASINTVQMLLCPDESAMREFALQI